MANEINPSKISRRTLAKGAAWSVPVVAVASHAPAFAASPNDVYGKVCKLTYGTGGVNTQNHGIYLGMESASGTLPPGASVTYTICLTTTNTNTSDYRMVPIGSYASGGSWTMEITPASKTTLSNGGCFTVKLTVGPQGTTNFCGAYIKWETDTWVQPGATVSITSSSSSGLTSSLVYKVAKRHPSALNTAGRIPHYYVSKGGVPDVLPRRRLHPRAVIERN